MKTIQYDNPSIGCWVDASCQSADDCNRRTIEFAEQYGFKVSQPLPDEDNEDYSEALSWEGDRAVDFLNGLETRPYISWFFEDNSLFLTPSVESARENVDFVSSKTQDYPPDDYEGEWLHVSDHGNATLYVRENGQDKEIWSVV